MTTSVNPADRSERLHTIKREYLARVANDLYDILENAHETGDYDTVWSGLRSTLEDILNESLGIQGERYARLAEERWIDHHSHLVKVTFTVPTQYWLELDAQGCETLEEAIAYWQKFEAPGCLAFSVGDITELRQVESLEVE